MRLLPERKAQSLQGVIAYGKYLLQNRDLLLIPYNNPTQWDVTAFKKWRRASCLTYIASRIPYKQSRDKLNIFYKEIDKWNSIYSSEEESLDSDVSNNTDSVNSNGEIVEGSRHDLNVNVSEILVGSVAEFVSNEKNNSSILHDVAATDTADATADDIGYDLNVNDAVERKEPKNISSNLNIGTATATATTDANAVDIDNAKFQSSIAAVPTTTTTTTTTASEIRVDMLSKEEVISNIPVTEHPGNS